jgi:uncharacterized membrane protein
MSPERFRLVVSAILIVGVATSAAFIAAGLAGSFLVGWEGSLAGAGPVDRATSDFGILPRGLTTLRPAALVQVGLVILLLTPVARVVASVVGFALERDWLYVAVTAAVLAILLTSLFVLR